MIASVRATSPLNMMIRTEVALAFCSTRQLEILMHGSRNR